jgi:hypothetical protein
MTKLKKNQIARVSHIKERVRRQCSSRRARSAGRVEAMSIDSPTVQRQRRGAFLGLALARVGRKPCSTGKPRLSLSQKSLVRFPFPAQFLLVHKTSQFCS